MQCATGFPKPRGSTGADLRVLAVVWLDAESPTAGNLDIRLLARPGDRVARRVAVDVRRGDATMQSGAERPVAADVPVPDDAARRHAEAIADLPRGLPVLGPLRDCGQDR